MISRANDIRTFFKSIVLFVLFSFIINISFASEHGAENKESFNAGEMISDHIADAHDWHLFDWKGHGVSVPLPIILYHTEKGFNVFMSSKFNHSHDEYLGYRIMTRHFAKENNINTDDFPLGKMVVMTNGLVDAESTAMIYDISITKNVTAMLFSVFLLLFIFIKCAKAYSKTEGHAPKGLQSFMEPIIVFIRDDIAKGSIGEKKYKKFMPYLLTLFFFIWFNNLLGLVPIIPGGANVTGNIAVPMVLALFTFVITTINGNAHYWKHIFAMPGVPKPILILLTPLEVIGIFIKPFVLVVRLFANITAGHIVILVFFSLIFIFGEQSASVGYGVSVASVAFSVFLFFLELLVGLIQAYVFTLLSAIYFGMAVAEDHH
ncbi:MAG: F0F1 ATP synthase subunit A [Bacteroidia bacterium]|nr:F0F1 ATP synthase subunit A [Bacteroidia bacterium]MBN4052132.1 F0F1 ATP synthase subunit A [Sphingobacteriaceae bacterium AH-315-L07]